MKLPVHYRQSTNLHDGSRTVRPMAMGH